MAPAPNPPIHLPPLEVAPETFLLRSARPIFGAPLLLYTNSLLIRGAEPVLVDTGTRADRDRWLTDLTSLVDPASIRWVFLSHHDLDHTGNLRSILELCHKATVVTCWAATDRLGGVISEQVRVRLVDVDETFAAGDRVVRVVRPPVCDGPTASALFDPATGVLWASDTFATPMPLCPVDHVDELPPRMWEEGMAMYHHHALSPWLPFINRDVYGRQVDRLKGLDPSVVVAAHTPVITGPSLTTAFERLVALPDTVPPPHPTPRSEGIAFPSLP